MRIITDSTCDLSLEYCARRAVEMLSLKVRFGDEEYLDKRTITNDEFYARLNNSKELPTTSLVSVGEFEESFSLAPEEDVVAILFSSKLSGTYQAALTARDITGRKNIYIIDSGIGTIAQGLLVEVACRFRDAGMMASKIAGEIARLTKKLTLYGVPDTLKFLIRGGRFPKTAGAVAEVMGIRPIITVVDGLMVKKEIVRGKKAAFDRLVELGLKESKIDPSLPLGFSGIRNPEEMARLQAAYGEYPDQLAVEMGPVVGTHIGTGALMVSFFTR